jgi:hypothetical protein
MASCSNLINNLKKEKEKKKSSQRHDLCWVNIPFNLCFWKGYMVQSLLHGLRCTKPYRLVLANICGLVLFHISVSRIHFDCLSHLDRCDDGLYGWQSGSV